MSSASVLSTAGLALALVAAIIALWQGRLLRRQLEQNQAINAMDVYVRVASTLRDLDMFFVDHAELRPYFYENKKLPRTKSQRDRLSAVSEMILDLAESVVASEAALGDMAVYWRRYFAFLYRNSEALRVHWREHSYYYADNIRDAFRASPQNPYPPDGPWQ